MTKAEIDAAFARLRGHAVDHGDVPPETIVSPDGGPSKGVMAYCNRHNLTLDWVLLGASPMNRRAAAR